MKLFLFSNTLVVAKDNQEAIKKFKEKLHYSSLHDLEESDIEEINYVDGCRIQIIV